MTLALLTYGEYLFLLPVALSIALVTAASHRDDMSEILSHALRAWAMLVGGILVFAIVSSYAFEWILP